MNGGLVEVLKLPLDEFLCNFLRMLLLNQVNGNFSCVKRKIRKTVVLYKY